MNPYLEGFNDIWRSPIHVRVDESRLREIARQWADEDFPTPSWRDEIFPQEDDETFTQCIGVANAINFCFTDPATKVKYALSYMGKQWSGAYAMQAALKRALDQGVPILNPDYLASMTRRKAERIFRGDTPIPMLIERVQCLRSASQALAEHFDGSYARLFERCEYRAFNGGQGIVEQLVNSDTKYSDASPYHLTGSLLCFHKRANLLVMMYQGRALSSEGRLPLIADAANLTPPADYQVPRTLRHLGILVYGYNLAHLVDNQIPLGAHSIWENEIRAMTVGAMLKLCAELTMLRGKEISIAALDFKVWSKARELLSPHHLTFTTAY